MTGAGIATIDGAEEQRVEVRRPGYVWAATVAAAVVAALLLVALAAAGAVDFLRRDGRQDQSGAGRSKGESASTSSDSLDTFMEGGLVVNGEGGAPGTDGRGADAATRPERRLGAADALAKLLVTVVALVVLLFAAAGLAVLLFAAACGPRCGAGDPSRDDSLESAARDTSR